MRFKCIILVISVLFSLTSFAQKKEKDRSGFTYGFGVGACMASGKNALFYNGADDKPNAVNNILGNSVVPYGSSSESTQSQIYNVLKDSIIGIQYPSKMTYNPAVTLQGYLGYIFEDKNSVYAQIKYSKLSTNGTFSIELASPDTTKFNSSEHRIVEGGLKASENRVDIEFGYHILLDKVNPRKPFIEIFGNINSVSVKSDQMSITTANGNFTSSLIHYTLNTINTNQTQGGMGYGFGATLGIEGQVKENMYYHLGLQASLKTIHLLDNPELTPHFDLFARILL